MNARRRAVQLTRSVGRFRPARREQGSWQRAEREERSHFSSAQAQRFQGGFEDLKPSSALPDFMTSTSLA